MAEYNNPDWENNSQHSDHSGDSLDNNLCLCEEWQAWKQKEHLARCCPICQDPYTAEGLGYDLEERAANARGAGSGPARSAWKAAPSARSIGTAHAIGRTTRAIATRYPSPCTAKLVAKESYGGSVAENGSAPSITYGTTTPQ